MQEQEEKRMNMYEYNVESSLGFIPLSFFLSL
jgi:hypothetical protein